MSLSVSFPVPLSSPSSGHPLSVFFSLSSRVSLSVSVSVYNVMYPRLAVSLFVSLCLSFLPLSLSVSLSPCPLFVCYCLFGIITEYQVSLYVSPCRCPFVLLAFVGLLQNTRCL